MSASTPTSPRSGRWLPFAATLSAVLLVLAACAKEGGASATSSEGAASEPAAPSASTSAEPPGSEPAAGAVELTMSETSAGTALAGEGDMTLYTFDNDTAGVSACTGGCVSTWPPLIVAAGQDATAGAGVTGDIGSITRDDGSTQVTYDGHLLYYYSDDQSAGDANGDGVGGLWHIASP
jgi:predicted lipoprotein with Yx(FWY)xxD motif